LAGSLLTIYPISIANNITHFPAPLSTLDELLALFWLEESREVVYRRVHREGRIWTGRRGGNRKPYANHRETRLKHDLKRRSKKVVGNNNDKVSRYFCLVLFLFFRIKIVEVSVRPVSE